LGLPHRRYTPPSSPSQNTRRLTRAKPAGGIAYGLAKRSIAQDRQERLADDRASAGQQRALRNAEARFRAERDVAASSSPSSSSQDGGGAGAGPGAGGAARVPTKPAVPLEKSKYAAAEVFRSQKGDRLR
jgi:hypothetical protein